MRKRLLSNQACVQKKKIITQARSNVAFHWLNSYKSTNAALVFSQNRAAKCYEDGLGCRKDSAKAVQFYR